MFSGASSTKPPGLDARTRLFDNASTPGITKVSRLAGLEEERMDLTFSEPELAFRDELRTWLADHHPGAEPEGDGDAHYAWRRDFQRRLADDGLQTRRPLADGVRRPRRDADAVGDLLKSSRWRMRRRWRTCSASGGRPHDHCLRHRRAKGALAPEDPHRRGNLVPGILRAERRIGSGGPADQARVDGDTYMVNGQKVWTSYGWADRLVQARRADRYRGAQAQGADRFPGGHEDARAGATAAADHGRDGVQRAVLPRWRVPDENLLGGEATGAGTSR